MKASSFSIYSLLLFWSISVSALEKMEVVFSIMHNDFVHIADVKDDKIFIIPPHDERFVVPAVEVQRSDIAVRIDSIEYNNLKISMGASIVTKANGENNFRKSYVRKIYENGILVYENMSEGMRFTHISYVGLNTLSFEVGQGPKVNLMDNFTQVGLPPCKKKIKNYKLEKVYSNGLASIVGSGLVFSHECLIGLKDLIQASN